tara:strand:- start:100 stop:942 length:843 start_codon:yes stop_codon:yes gene_type:complete
MKITKKILEKLIKEEVKKAMNEDAVDSSYRKGYKVTVDGARRETGATMARQLKWVKGKPRSQKALRIVASKLGIANNGELREMFFGKSIRVISEEDPVYREWTQWVNQKGYPQTPWWKKAVDLLFSDGAQADETIFAFVANYYATRGIRGAGGTPFSDRELPPDLDESKNKKISKKKLAQIIKEELEVAIKEISEDPCKEEAYKTHSAPRFGKAWHNWAQCKMKNDNKFGQQIRDCANRSGPKNSDGSPRACMLLDLPRKTAVSIAQDVLGTYLSQRKID